MTSIILILLGITAGSGLGWWAARRRQRELPRESLPGAAEAQFHALVELSPDAILIHRDSRFVYANPAALRLLGAASWNDVVGKPATFHIPEDLLPLVLERIARQQRGETVPRMEQRYRRLDGRVVDVEVTSAPFVYQGRAAVQVFARDITERKRSERRIERLTNLYSALGRTGELVARARSRQELFDGGCRIAVEHGRLRMTWIGLADSQTQAIQIASAHGAETDCAAAGGVSIDASVPAGQGPIGTAFREACAYVCNDFEKDDRTSRWREAALKKGFSAMAVFPLRQAGSPVGVIVHMAGEPGYFAQDLVDLLERMAIDLSHALDMLAADEQRTRTEAALFHSERTLSTLMSNLPGMVYRCRDDSEWTVEFASEGCFDLTGYRAEEVIDNKLVSFKELIAEPDRAKVADEIQGAIERRERFEIEYRLVHRSGALRWVSEKGAAVYGHDGSLEALEGFILDITERKRTQEDLQRFRAAMDTTADAIFLIDLATLRYIDVTETTCRMLGYSRPQLLTMGPRDINVGFDEAELRARFAKVRELGEDRYEVDPGPRWLRRRDGSSVPVEVYRRYVRIGNQDLIVAGARDVSERLQAEQELTRFRAAIDMSRDAIFLIDRESMRYIDVNDMACRLFGLSREEFLQMGPQDLNPNLSREDLERRFDEAIALGGAPTPPESVGRLNRRSDGSTFPVEVYRRSIRVGGRDIIVAFTRDISERLQAEEALRLRTRAIEASTSAVVITNALAPDNPIEYVNPAFEAMTGYQAGEVVGHNCRFLQGTERDQPGLNELRKAIGDGRDAQVVLHNYRKDGTAFWAQLTISPVRDAAGRVSHFVGIIVDITEAVRYREALEHQATHDALTGLPNRNLLTDRLTQAIANAQRHGWILAVIFLDLNNFKLVNDTLGHRAGDDLLKAVANRLRNCVREGDTIARLGGDEFVLLMNEQPSKESVTQAVQRIVQALAQPLSLEGHEISSTCSVGISLFPNDGADGETLLKHADTAMYRAKAAGHAAFQFFSAEMNINLAHRLSMEASLRRALEREEFELHYQPRIGLRSGAVEAVEALIRWRSGELGLVSPAQFIPVAEETGLIVAIGEWVLRTACAQMQAWHRLGIPAIGVSVNLSPRQFKRPQIVQEIASALEESGLAPRFLEIEVTESMVMESGEDFVSRLQAIRHLGVVISIDDFGTGYSNLNYLKRFPVDRLKVDQSFVRDMTTDADDAAIARAIVQLGHSLDLEVTAEGVETKEQLEFLRACRCDQAQGFLFSRPLPAKEIEEQWLKTDRRFSDL